MSATSSLRWLTFLLAVASLAGVCYCGDYISNTSKLRERMKLISGYTSNNNNKHAEDSGGAQTSSYYQDIDYAQPKLNGRYQAETKFNRKGMGHLYYVTNLFMDFVQKKDALPDGVLSVRGGRIEVADVRQEWKSLLKQYSGLAAVLGAGLIFSVLMPCIGLVYCCCRCSGKCGDRGKHKRPRDGCKRATLATFLSAVAVFILFGVVCAFVTNEYMKTSTESLTKNFKTNVKDAELFLSNSKIEVDNLLVVNFQQLETTLTELLGETGEIVRAQLANASRAIALTNLTAIVKGLDTIKRDLQDIKTTSDILQNNASEFATVLESTREDIIHRLRSCQRQPACSNFLNRPEIHELRVVQNFSELPDISTSLRNITELLGTGSIDSIQAEVLDGQKNFDTIKDEIMVSVRATIPHVTRAIQEAGQQLRQTSKTIKRSVDEVQNVINRHTGKTIDEAGEYINKYAIYRYYVGLGISCALLLILTLLVFGLLCGICGKKPYDYGDDSDCCNKPAGGRFLMLGVWIMFLCSTVLMLASLSLFSVGMLADRGVCQPLYKPQDNKIFTLVDQLVKIDNVYQGHKVEVNLSQVIVSCHQNRSLYDTLKLDQMMDIEDVKAYKRRYQIEEQINNFKNHINVRTDRIELLTPEAKRKLNGLANSPLNNIQFDKYTAVLDKQITSINLTRISRELLDTVERIPIQDEYDKELPKIRNYLKSKATFLDHLQNHFVLRIRADTEYLKQNVSSLEHHLKFNHTNLKSAVQNLLIEIGNAQNYLKKNGTSELKLLVDAYAEEFTSYVDKYLERVVHHTHNEIGRCGPLSNVYNSTVMVACKRILEPFNGFWASVGWCVIMFIPAIILSAKLSVLYQKSSAYTTGPYGESEYLYDAYADRDSVPLANVDKKNKNHHRSYNETYDNSTGAYLQDYSSHLGRAERPSASSDSRYNDMAPKNWTEFQGSRGPPRYQQPPSTEYERPPPYYYPGPGERS